MSDEDQSFDKTEQPTPKRLKEAREKGQIPRSKDLNTSLTLIAGGIALLMFGPALLQDMCTVMRESFVIKRESLLIESFMVTELVHVFEQGIFSLLPIFILMVLAAFAGPLLMGGVQFSAQALTPKMSRMSLMAGMKRMFSAKSVMELIKALLKFIVIASLSLLIINFQLTRILTVGDGHIDISIYRGIFLVGVSFLAISATTLVIAGIDAPFQWWQHIKQLKMSKQEIKDEYKESEGSPELKGRIRRAQQTIAQARMMQDVPTADVIITNPTHYAIALRYDQEKGNAPRLIAKGKDFMAEQIKKVAVAHEVPIVNAPPLARSIFFNTKLNHEIPYGLYVSVAQVLAYVYQLKRSHKGTVSKPAPLREFNIPEELQVEEQ